MKLLARLGLIAGILVSAFTFSASAQQPDPDNQLTVTTDKGSFVIQLRPDLAPHHVEQIKKLAAEGFYNGVVFHRVIDGFMAQTGDPTGTGTGGSQLPDLQAEFSNETFDRGTVGMARAQDPNSANSQFFIMLADGDFLDGQYTVVGDVVSGMEIVDQIKKGDEAQNGSVADPDKMLSVTVGNAS
ncbi:peptidylprolyl isomerase [Aureimonas altamirensis]|jgi:peptidylprolyl isomerase|uniref:Peptidyl-prolyl cis-trans isomerase n=2 Tax=Aureimonas altamirensis TaxID=370622 RepID=A0A0P0YXL2_9HYPH|nr:peptidylprolyl isomerase [Aureimonas altamirensis]BAT26302.1 cyclophilin type peptidyl-prolyl cis-trans isomerase [Aureimonas altamirensis]SHJ43611.1 peptidylprolyl isomerase [Aureimonas altamirensis DSM 21988]